MPVAGSLQRAAEVSQQPRIDEHVKLRIGRTEHAAPVGVVPGPPIPEAVEVERRREDRRRVARLHPAQALEQRDRIDFIVHQSKIRQQRPHPTHRSGAERAGTDQHVLELPEPDAHRRHDVVAVLEHVFRIEQRFAGDVGIRQPVEREVADLQVQVGGAAVQLQGVVTSLVVGVQLVPGAVVHARDEVAGGAGLDAVAADLHVPEQRLAQHLGALAPDVRPAGREGQEQLYRRARSQEVELADGLFHLVDLVALDVHRLALVVAPGHSHDLSVGGQQRVGERIGHHQLVFGIHHQIPDDVGQGGGGVAVVGPEQLAGLIPADFTVRRAQAQRLPGEHVVARIPDLQWWQGHPEAGAAGDVGDALVGAIGIVTADRARVVQNLRDFVPQRRLLQRSRGGQLGLDLDGQLLRNGRRLDAVAEQGVLPGFDGRQLLARDGHREAQCCQKRSRARRVPRKRHGASSGGSRRAEEVTRTVAEIPRKRYADASARLRKRDVNRIGHKWTRAPDHGNRTCTPSPRSSSIRNQRAKPMVSPNWK